MGCGKQSYDMFVIVVMKNPNCAFLEFDNKSSVVIAQVYHMQLPQGGKRMGNADK